MKEVSDGSGLRDGLNEVGLLVLSNGLHDAPRRLGVAAYDCRSGVKRI